MFKKNKKIKRNKASEYINNKYRNMSYDEMKKSPMTDDEIYMLFGDNSEHSKLSANLLYSAIRSDKKKPTSFGIIKEREINFYSDKEFDELSLDEKLLTIYKNQINYIGVI